MRFVLLGTSEFIIACAEGVIASEHELAALITLRPEFLPDNSANVPAAAEKLGVPSYQIADVNSQESIDLLKSLNPDYLFVSWPKIIKPPVLEVPKYFVIGTHPTELPANRGRHPLHWCIVLGIPGTALSFFRMDSGVDTGNILQSVPIEVGDHSILEVGEEMIRAGREGLRRLIDLLEKNPDMPGAVQDHSKANYWRARNAHDGIIDFRMCAAQLERLARSFSPPYACVKLLFEEHLIAITSVEPQKSSLSPVELERIEPGKVLAADSSSVTVKAADGIVICRVLGEAPAELARAKYIFPPTYYLEKWGSQHFFPGGRS